MSRRGKNSVKSAMLRDASHAVMSSFAKPAEPKTVAVNNFNPLFHYLQTMFPNYDNAVLNSVLEQEGNSIERAIEVLLSFADAEPAKTTVVSGDDWVEDDDDDDHTPSNVFAVPVMPPVTSQNSGRDHVVLCEYQKKKKIKANRQQRAKKRQQRAAQEQARVATPQPKKKVRWVPLQDFITETRNSFDVLRDYDDDAALLADLQQQSPTESDPNEDTLLSPDEIRESWEELEATLAHEEEGEEKQVEADSGDDDFVSTDEEWLPFTPAPPSFAPSSEDEAFVVIEEKLPVAEPEVCDQTAAPVVAPEVVIEQQQKQEEEKKPEQVVVVKLYYSASDIHRLRFPRSAFTFAKLHTYAATYLDSKCQLLAKEALPRAFALTYVDDEGDVIHLCSEEELAEALRLHDEAFWAEGNQPIMRLHIKPLVDGALHAGHVTAGRSC